MTVGDKVKILTWTIFGDTGTVIVIQQPSALSHKYPIIVQTSEGHEVGYYPEELIIIDSGLVDGKIYNKNVNGIGR